MKISSEQLTVVAPLVSQIESLEQEVKNSDAAYAAAKAAFKAAKEQLAEKQSELRAALGKQPRVVSEETRIKMSRSHLSRWQIRKANTATAPVAA